MELKSEWTGWISKASHIEAVEEGAGTFRFSADLNKRLFMALPSVPSDVTFLRMVSLLIDYCSMLKTSATEDQVVQADSQYADCAELLLKLNEARLEVDTLKQRISDRAADQIEQLNDLLNLQESIHKAATGGSDLEPAQGMPIHDAFATAILDAISSYRSRLQADGDGAGMPLVDLLTPASARTISIGKEELSCLGDYLFSELAEHIQASKG
jgi:hypothetical protein